ncbi:MAG TPA: aspartate aminotransferase family protein [Thermoanaerobacter sp.]|jgi:4-aminobutyrate aminotransferase|uniref:Putative 4-aminobutyrate transaminase n=1 Tax=Acetomicrobium hydrogeniformans ATCC BAA-1850 TaxID=592015 RepID=A0A0T5X8C3_9BACT|nr:aspartate aminotransferase family protein [Acetomicrobium hydrogeniformans]KRT34700.1 putative 4-aminobutyrate transaminase [Acetomicrobium hydrogeniformans ATCC BAA-1850]MDN5313340.1 4-aminobutyrate aminotransferase [Thermoanaerobacteraceae bacterium]HAA81091.1 aspartate aminotransferase family protein [Thermoanaerobacter sp.]
MWEKVKRYTEKTLEENLKIADEEDRYIPKACSLKYYPLVIKEASGSTVIDVDNNEFIDFLTSAAVFNIGHNHPRVVKAAKDQIDRVINYTMAYFYEKQPIELAKKLTEITPGNFSKKVTFGFSGSDSVDSSIKASRAFTGRHTIMAFKDSYHGMTYGALSATGIVNQDAKKRLGVMDVQFVEFPDPYRNSFGIDGYEHPEKLSNNILKAIDRTISSLKEKPACIIMEPIQGDAGAIVPPMNFFKGLKELADSHNILLIDEEVQTGMGRTGRLWAIEHFKLEPDLLVTAKALGGGFPISATVGKAEILDSVPQPLLVFTHIGHAVNASAALATIEVVEEENLSERAAHIGKKAMDEFKKMSDSYPIIGDVRGLGLLIGVDIIKPGTKEPDKNTAQKICWRAWEKGLILITFGKHGNVLRIAPPLNISQEELDRGLNIIDEAIQDVLKDRVSDDILKFLRGW